MDKINNTAYDIAVVGAGPAGAVFVKEIAAAVGYSDIYQFSRAYKRHFGFPPSKTE